MGTLKENEEQNLHKKILFSRREILGGALGLFALSLFPKRAEAAPSMILNGESVEIDPTEGRFKGIFGNVVCIEKSYYDKGYLITERGTGLLLGGGLVITAGHVVSKAYEKPQDPESGFSQVELGNDYFRILRYNQEIEGGYEENFVKAAFDLQGLDIALIVLQNNFDKVAPVSFPKSGSDSYPEGLCSTGYGVQKMNRNGKNFKEAFQRFTKIPGKRFLKDLKRFFLNSSELISDKMGLLIRPLATLPSLQKSTTPGDSGGPLIDIKTNEIWGIASSISIGPEDLFERTSRVTVVQNIWTNLSTQQMQEKIMACIGFYTQGAITESEFTELFKNYENRKSP